MGVSYITGKGMDQNYPKVSIGLAVYNGARYLNQAIDSILAQTYTDFELIISDNASTDETAEICQEYLARDKRIRYSRNETNIGGANNENRTFLLSHGKYFRWAAHDDVCAPELISKCVEVLDHQPSLVLCYSMITDINENGEPLRTISQQKGTSEKPSDRFRELSKKDHNCEATYGLIRADLLRKTQLQKNYTDSDRTLLCELSLYGKFYEIPEPLFYKRYHPKNMYANMRARMAWFKPALKGKAVFPYWMQFFDYLATIHKVPLPRAEKIRCYLYMLRWFIDHGKNLAGDIFFALLATLRPSKDPNSFRNRNKNLYNWE
jgi:glycosyltransferase involved in cell wall biosynthesis